MKQKVKVVRESLDVNERITVKQTRTIEEGGNVKAVDSHIYLDKKEVATYFRSPMTQPTLAFNKDRKLSEGQVKMIISIVKDLYMTNDFKITEYFNV